MTSTTGVGPLARPTLADVAVVAAVSTQTVSNAFSHPERVATATLDRVRTAAAQLGFTPNLAARALRGRSRALLGLALPDLRSAYMRALAHAFDAAGWARGFHVQIVSGRDEDDRAAAIEGLLHLGAAGALSVRWSTDPRRSRPGGGPRRIRELEIDPGRARSADGASLGRVDGLDALETIVVSDPSLERPPLDADTPSFRASRAERGRTS